MSTHSAGTEDDQALLSLPSNGLAYVAILAALVSAGVHLLLAPRVMGFDQTTGVLFYLNAAGFLGGVLLFLSRYWRRVLYLVAVGYALATIVAFFVLSGRLNELSVVAKTAEGVLAVVATYLYVTGSSP